jgi:hypothetical protein
LLLILVQRHECGMNTLCPIKQNFGEATAPVTVCHNCKRRSARSARI